MFTFLKRVKNGTKPGFMNGVESMSVRVQLGYLEAEKTIANIFFDEWR